MPHCPCLRELELRAEQRRVGIDERRPIALEQFRRRELAVVLGQFGLVVEQFQVARCAGLEDVDHPLRLRREMRLSRRERIVAAGAFARTLGGQQRTGGDAGQPDAAVAQEPAAAEEWRGPVGVLDAGS